MKNNIFKRSLALFLALVCVLGILPLSAFAADATPPASITQVSSAYVTINGSYVRYHAASSAINNVGLPYVFNEQVNIPGYGTGRALCAYQLGTLGNGANGQKWNFEAEVTATPSSSASTPQTATEKFSSPGWSRGPISSKRSPPMTPTWSTPRPSRSS